MHTANLRSLTTLISKSSYHWKNAGLKTSVSHGWYRAISPSIKPWRFQKWPRSPFPIRRIFQKTHYSTTVWYPYQISPSPPSPSSTSEQKMPSTPTRLCCAIFKWVSIVLKIMHCVLYYLPYWMSPALNSWETKSNLGTSFRVDFQASRKLLVDRSWSSQAATTLIFLKPGLMPFWSRWMDFPLRRFNRL